MSTSRNTLKHPSNDKRKRKSKEPANHEPKNILESTDNKDPVRKKDVKNFTKAITCNNENGKREITQVAHNIKIVDEPLDANQKPKGISKARYNKNMKKDGDGHGNIKIKIKDGKKVRNASTVKKEPEGKTQFAGNIEVGGELPKEPEGIFKTGDNKNMNKDGDQQAGNIEMNKKDAMEVSKASTGNNENKGNTQVAGNIKINGELTDGTRIHELETCININKGKKQTSGNITLNYDFEKFQ